MYFIHICNLFFFFLTFCLSLQADLYGQSILNYIHPDDHALIRKQLLPNDIDKLLNPHRNDDNEESQPLTQEEEDRIDGTLKEDKRNFTVRFARAGSRSEPTTYEVVRITGSFRRADLAARGTKPTTFPSAYPLKRTQPRGREDIFPIHTINGNDIVSNYCKKTCDNSFYCKFMMEA